MIQNFYAAWNPLYEIAMDWHWYVSQGWLLSYLLPFEFVMVGLEDRTPNKKFPPLFFEWGLLTFLAMLFSFYEGDVC